ncbi:MAG: nuclear transport factor 2 family protein [Pyrinomonadaceae bacterium]
MNNDQTAAQNKQIIEKANDLVADGNYQQFVNLCAEDVKWTILSQGEPMTLDGRDAIVDFMGPKSNKPSDPPAFTITKIIADDDGVASCGEMTMKEKDGSTSYHSFCDIYTFKDGQITDLITHMNRTDAQRGKENSASA